MKAKMKLLVGLLLAGMFSSMLTAQVTVTPAVDFYSNYIWRGTKFGTGPAMQPSVKLTTGGLSAGIWGSFDASGYTEADPYISYNFPFGLSFGITNYYYPGTSLFEFANDTSSMNAIELNLGYTIGGLSLSGNYIINKAGYYTTDSLGKTTTTGPGSSGGDIYIQGGYTISNVTLFIGAGNEWLTSDAKFKLCNIGITTTKEIKITDTFSIPVTGQVIVNPDKEQLYLVVGLTF